MIPFLKTAAHVQPERVLPFMVNTARGLELDALAALLGWPARLAGETDETVRGRICGTVAPHCAGHGQNEYRGFHADYRGALAEMMDGVLAATLHKIFAEENSQAK